MNLAQTCQVLSYLAATHPNFPKYTPEDKQRVAVSYFRILYRFSLSDVLNAVDAACRKARPFLPCVYDIEHEICKSIDVEKFLTAEYYDLEHELTELKSLSSVEIKAMNDDELYAHIADIRAHESIILKMREKACEQADYEYMHREAELSLPDRQKLGVLSDLSLPDSKKLCMMHYGNTISDNSADHMHLQ